MARGILRTVPFSIDMSELERYASELDQEQAVDLRGALAWFGADEDGPTVCVSRYDLQQFLHYTLPRKYLAEVEEHIAVARALGDGLEHLGAPGDYVDLCRSPETLALIRLWALDEDAASAQFAAFADASGLEPPDVDELAWQPVMGLVEARTRDAATLALERALESGDGRPAAEIVRAVLAEPDPDGEQPTRLRAVQAERIDRWARWGSSERRGLLESLVGELADAPVPEWPADDVFDWLLEEARAGLALTERGALSRAVAVEIGRRRPAWTWGTTPRSEADVEHLRVLHAALRRSGLVRRRGRTLLATKRAGELAPGARRVRLLESLLGEESFLAAVAELALAALVQGTPEARDRVSAVIEADGWRSDDGFLPSHAVPSAMTEVNRLLIAIGAAQGDPLSHRQECALTELGRAAVLCALRTNALRPAAPRVIPPEPQPSAVPRAERAAVVLPPVPGGTPAHLDPMNTDDRAELICLAHPELAAAVDAGEEVVVIGGETVNPRLHLLMHQVVAERLLYDDPPEDWIAFSALLDDGADAHDAQHAIGQRFVEELMAAVGPPPASPPRPRANADRRTRDRRKAQRAARRRNRR